MYNHLVLLQVHSGLMRNYLEKFQETESDHAYKRVSRTERHEDSDTKRELSSEALETPFFTPIAKILLVSSIGELSIVVEEL